MCLWIQAIFLNDDIDKNYYLGSRYFLLIMGLFSLLLFFAMSDIS